MTTRQTYRLYRRWGASRARALARTLSDRVAHGVSRALLRDSAPCPWWRRGLARIWVALLVPAHVCMHSWQLAASPLGAHLRCTRCGAVDVPH